MAFVYTIKNIELDMNDMSQINQYYCQACTAEYILENYDFIKDQETALEIACGVRNRMDKYDEDELTAIDNEFKKRGLI